MIYYPLSDLIEQIIRWITHGGPFGEPDFYMTTRWHRIKCRVRSRYYLIKGRVLDWIKDERYVPLYCLSRNELRAVRFSGLSVHGDVIYVRSLYGTALSFTLPPDCEMIREVPQFTTSDACFEHISKTWPHLSP